MSRRTVVFFHLGSELVYLELADLAAKPTKNDSYTFDGQRYLVSDVTESIGEFKSDGNKRSGIDKLLELLALRFSGQEVTLMAQMRSIGSGDQPQPGPGGIVLPNKKLIGDFDHAILVVLKPTGGKMAGGVLTRVHAAVRAQTGDESVVPETTQVQGAPAITVGPEAASE